MIMVPRSYLTGGLPPAAGRADPGCIRTSNADAAGARKATVTIDDAAEPGAWAKAGYAEDRCNFVRSP